MKHVASIFLAAGVAMALTSAALAQNYAPSINYQTPRHEAVVTGRSAFVASTPRVTAHRSQPAVDSAPLGYAGALPSAD